MAEELKSLIKENIVVTSWDVPLPIRVELEKLNLEEKNISTRKRLLDHKEYLFFDNTNPILTSHEMSPEIYYELKRLGYSIDTIPTLMKDIISRYEKLLPIVKKDRVMTPERDALASALFLTCRGQYICPVDLKRYPRLIREQAISHRKPSGFEQIDVWARKIGERIRFSSDELFDNAIKKLLKQGLINEDVEKRCRQLYETDKKSIPRPTVTRNYIGGLVYFACKLENRGITQKIISESLDIDYVTLGKQYLRIQGRLKIS